MTDSSKETGDAELSIMLARKITEAIYLIEDEEKEASLGEIIHAMWLSSVFLINERMAAIERKKAIKQ